MRARALLFDKDGTLFDFQKTWAPWVGRVVEILAGGDDTLAGRLDAAWGYDRASGRIGRDSIVIAGNLEQVAAAVFPLLKNMKQQELLELIDATGAAISGVEVVPLPAFLASHRQAGLRLGVATNDSEATARAQLDRAGVLAQFEFIAGYDSGFGAKPDPGMCLAFVGQMGLAPHEAVMVGDSVHDLRAGRAAGMQTAAVLTGVAGRRELAPFADVILPGIGDLPAWLEGGVASVQI